MSPDGADGPVLVVNPQLVRTAALTYWDPAAGRRAELGPGADVLLRRFAVPSTVLAACGAAADATVRQAVDSLLERGLLVTHRPAAPAGYGRGGLFGAPVMSVGQALAG
jgi:hypothetical protein